MIYVYIYVVDQSVDEAMLRSYSDESSPASLDTLPNVHSGNNSNNEFTSNRSPESNKAKKAVRICIKAHFTYDELKFHKLIKADNFSEFYTQVLSTFVNKKPGYKPSSLQYQFGTEWYNLNEDMDIDDLCLDDSNPEISIQAKSKTKSFESIGIGEEFFVFMNVISSLIQRTEIYSVFTQPAGDRMVQYSTVKHAYFFQCKQVLFWVEAY